MELSSKLEPAAPRRALFLWVPDARQPSFSAQCSPPIPVSGYDRGCLVQGNEAGEEIRALVVDIAKALVDAPAEVVLELAERPESTTLRLRVAPADVGKVIGRQGRTARSIRTILAAVGMKYRHRFALEIIEEHGDGAAHPAELAHSS